MTRKKLRDAAYTILADPDTGYNARVRSLRADNGVTVCVMEFDLDFAPRPRTYSGLLDRSRCREPTADSGVFATIADGERRRNKPNFLQRHILLQSTITTMADRKEAEVTESVADWLSTPRGGALRSLAAWPPRSRRAIYSVPREAALTNSVGSSVCVIIPVRWSMTYRFVGSC